MQQFSKFYIRIIFNPKYFFHEQTQSERTCCQFFFHQSARSVLSLALSEPISGWRRHFYCALLLGVADVTLGEEIDLNKSRA